MDNSLSPKEKKRMSKGKKIALWIAGGVVGLFAVITIIGVIVMANQPGGFDAAMASAEASQSAAAQAKAEEKANAKAAEESAAVIAAAEQQKAADEQKKADDEKHAAEAVAAEQQKADDAKKAADESAAAVAAEEQKKVVEDLKRAEDERKSIEEAKAKAEAEAAEAAAKRAHCLPVDQTMLEVIAEGASGSAITPVKGIAVKSNDYKEAYMIAMEFSSPGGSNEVGVWTSGSLQPGGSLLMAVDAYATTFTHWPDSMKSSFKISSADHGVAEAKKCLKGM